MAEKILEVKDLVIKFKTDNGLVQAVRNVSFDLYKGETLCIVGESGSGKSVTSKTIMGILADNAIVESGTVMYEGENLLDVSEEEFHKIRGHKIGMIFQDPLSSLNPIVRIGKQITEATLVNANKLKRKYNDLISKEEIAYKNAIAKYNITKSKLNYTYSSFKESKLKELKAAKKEKNIELCNSIRNEIKEQYDNLKVELAKNEETFKANKPALKQALKEKKAEAKQEIKEYKESLLAKYNETVNAINEKKNAYLSEYETNIQGKSESEISKLNEEKAAFLKQINAELKDAKSEYVNSTRVTKAEAKRKALEIMKEVGIPQPEKRFRQYPFEFSGGMRQRIVIAIALTANPEVLICDEPTTALDVTIQAQILELINNLKKERNLSCIFITHDLGVVANMADRVAVMYAGKIVEYGKAEEIFYDPKHPYTWALLSSIPDVDSKERLESIPGTPPDMIYPPKGDAFAARSKYAMEIDYKYQPPFFKVSDTHYAATWLLHPNAPKVEMPKIVSERIKISLNGGAANGNQN